MNSVSGISTISETKLAKCSRKNGEPQCPQRVRSRHHHLHQPPGMRAGVIAERKLEHVLEEHRAHHLVLAMGEPVGVERDERAADDGEEAEADPGADQRIKVQRQLRGVGLGIGQRVDARTGSVPRTWRRRAPGWRAPGSSPDGPRAREARARAGRDEELHGAAIATACCFAASSTRAMRCPRNTPMERGFTAAVASSGATRFQASFVRKNCVTPAVPCPTRYNADFPPR